MSADSRESAQEMTPTEQYADVLARLPEMKEALKALEGLVIKWRSSLEGSAVQSNYLRDLTLYQAEAAVKTVYEQIPVLRQQAEREGLEEAARLACPYCMVGCTPVPKEGSWLHPDPGGDLECLSYRIHRKLAELEVKS